MPYEHKSFPKVVYFEDGRSQVVQDEDEFSKAKSDGAKESPAEFQQARSDAKKK